MSESTESKQTAIWPYALVAALLCTGIFLAAFSRFSGRGETYVENLAEGTGEWQCLKGTRLAESGNIPEALEAYAAAAGLAFEAPRSKAACLAQYGALLVREGRYEEALAPLRESVEYDVSYAPAYAPLCTVLEKTGRMEEWEIMATAWFAYARSTAERARAKEQLGRALLKQGRTDEALDAFLAGHRIQTASHNAYYIGRIYDERGDWDAALYYYGAYLEFGMGDRAQLAHLRREFLLERQADEAPRDPSAGDAEQGE